MPFEQTELSEEEKKKQLEQQTNSFGGQTIGAGAGAEIQPSSLGAAPSASRLSPVTPQSPTQSFGTIQDYFKGSREQGERFGEQFTGKLAETQQQQRGEIGQAALGATQDIKAGTIGFDESLISSALADPTKVASDEGQFEDFLAQWNAAYKGPESFEGSTQYGQAAKAAQAAQSTATQLGTTGGRQQLIQDKFGVYGRGKKGLDEALLQQSSFFPKTQEQAKGFRTLQDYLASQSETVGTDVQAAKAATEATKQQARGAFQGRLTKFQEDLNTRTAAAQEKANVVLEKYKTNFAGADPRAIMADLKEAGVDTDIAQNIIDKIVQLKKSYDISPDLPGGYITAPPSAINPGTVASKEDYEKAQAYQKLTGRDYSGVLNPADIGKAGTGISAKPAFETGSIQDYLKQTLTGEDKAFLSAPVPRLHKVRANITNSQHAGKLVKKYIGAYDRQGDKPKNLSELTGPLREVMDQAFTEIRPLVQAATQQGGNLSDPSFYQRPEFDSVRGFATMLEKVNAWMASNSQPDKKYKFS